MANTISVSVLADVRDIRNKLGSVDSQLSGFGKTTKKIGGLIAGAFAGTAVISGVKTMISSASDLNETISKTKTIFGDSSPAIMKWSKDAAKNLGLSQQSALDGISTFGNFFNQIGIGAKETEKMSKSFIQASVDLGSFHNAAPTEVMDALAAATRGEYDSLQKFIPTINAARVEMEAMRQTGKTSAKELTDQDKARAVSALVMKGQGKAAGDFARTQDSLANKTKIAKAQFDNMVSTLGTALLPIATTVMTFIADTAIPKLKAWGDIFVTDVIPVIKDFGKFLKENKDVLIALVAGVAAGVAAFQIYTAVVKVVTAVTAAWNVIQKVLNGTMKANPIGLVVTAIGLLVAAFVLAYNKSETFKAIVDKVFKALKNVASTVFPAIKDFIVNAFNKAKDVIGNAVGFIKDKWATIKEATQNTWQAVKDHIINPITNAVNSVKEKVGAAKEKVIDAWQTIKTRTVDIWNGINDTVREKIQAVKEKVDGIKDKVTGVFANAGNWLTGAGRAIVQGLGAGIDSMYQWIRDKVNALSGWIPGWVKKALGIASPSKVMKQLGKYTAQGLVLGMTSQQGKIVRAASDMARNVEQGFTAPRLALNATSGGSGGNNYTINVTATPGTDKAALGKEIISLINAAERSGVRRLA